MPAASLVQEAPPRAPAANATHFVALIVTDQNGCEHAVTGAVGRKLMEVLRELDYGVAAACGGLCSCATCHVYIDDAWVTRLPECQSDERDALTDLSHYQATHSRLSCQLTLSAELDGLRLVIAPDG